MGTYFQGALSVASAVAFLAGVNFVFLATSASEVGTITDKTAVRALIGVGWLLVALVLQITKALTRKI